jgi:phosphate transport system substrate-binding protein
MEIPRRAGTQQISGRAAFNVLTEVTPTVDQAPITPAVPITPSAPLPPAASTSRKRAKRITRTLALATASAGMLLAACSSSSTPASGTSSTSASGSSDPYITADLKAASAQLTGAGSTFVAPVFTKAFFTYTSKNQGVTVNYQAVGSGAGITAFDGNTVNFGASDVPLSQAQVAAAPAIFGGVVQVPDTLGGVSLSYNLPGVATGLKLDAPTISSIFSGGITTWNDPAIVALNPGVTLPSQPITTVHRSDSSGTTYIFTDYLANVSPAWAAGPGTGKTVTWPASSVGSSGNSGVAGSIKSTPYSIGYVELAYALQNNFTVAAVKNQAGSFVTPSLKSVAADAAQKPNVTSIDFSITNQPGAGSYPISGYSWALVAQKQSNAAVGKTLVQVLDWMTHTGGGQDQAASLDYVPLPANIQALARQTLLMVTGPTGTAPLLTNK